ncbi:hypothetical protein ACIPC1_36075 [Streptomyces sp. NPDC087263]|uniref:hypothetical protein n=1 Tax=Streptomyces sp. NPDC087263 TaxID=3365773 RepID=UPI00381619AE
MVLQLLWNAVAVAMTLVMQWAFEALRNWLRVRRSAQLRSGARRPTTEGVTPSSDGRSEPAP